MSWPLGPVATRLFFDQVGFDISCGRDDHACPACLRLRCFSQPIRPCRWAVHSMLALPVGWVMLGKPEVPQQDVSFLGWVPVRYRESRRWVHMIDIPYPHPHDFLYGGEVNLALALLAHLKTCPYSTRNRHVPTSCPVNQQQTVLASPNDQ